MFLCVLLIFSQSDLIPVCDEVGMIVCGIQFYFALFRLRRATLMVIASTLSSYFLVYIMALMPPCRFPNSLHSTKTTQLLGIHMATATVSAVFTAFERRHLMTWSIFAPKLAFELIITLVIALLAPALAALDRVAVQVQHAALD